MSTNPPFSRANGSNGVIGRLRSLHTARQPDEAHEAEDVSDELTALFLDDAPPQPVGETRSVSCDVELKVDDENDRVGNAGHSPKVTLVVLGNLPVFAGAWASQLARDRQALSGRPLGLLTIDDESARLEVFGAAGRMVVGAPHLDTAMTELAKLDADLLVRLPEAEAGWIGASTHVDGITLLTGADDPAIVAAYRSLKAIIQELPGEAEVAGVRVAVAGSEPAVAGEASNKLAQASSRFLGLQVESEAPVAQIDAGASAELFHGSPPAWADVPDLLSRFATAPREAVAVEAQPVPNSSVESRLLPDRPNETGEGTEPIAIPPVETTRPVAAEVQMNQSSQSIPTGLSRIDVKCPYASGVGIAIDGDDVLHAVAWAEDANECSSAVRDLVVASSWIRDHTELIAVLLGKPLSAEPSERHLVLSHGRGALGIAQGELKVHVSVPDSAVLVDLN